VLSDAQAAGAATLALGMVDDCDETWVNGQRVGGLCGWDTPRRHPITAGVLQAGTNTIAVRVTDTGGGGGFHGAASALQLQTAAGDVPLAGRWKARPAAPMARDEPQANDLPTLAFNGMLQPLRPLRLRGVLWYQGESNVPRAARYAAAQRRLIADWRAHWGQATLPFYYVQLASFLPLARNTLAGSPWAELREAQREVLDMPHTGMAVAIDVGDADDIHPRNKQAVGDRLARLALRDGFGQPVVAQGPVLRAARRQGGQMVLRFDHAHGGLALRPGAVALQGFAVAGADQRFRPASARIEGARVVVGHAEVPQPVAVRYGWVDNAAEANLVNRAGLPASPFRTDRWRLVTDGVRFSP
jgi:sialate O-acetylesterase